MAEESEEQVELIKQWLKHNGTRLIVTILVVLAAVFGFRSWENQTRESSEAASVIYQELTDAIIIAPPDTLTAEQASTGKFLATQLKEDHSATAYANFAAFHLAKIAVEAGDLDTAANELQWALDNSVDDRLAVITNLRLARVKYSQGDFESSLAQLKNLAPGAHSSSYAELEGDALQALGRTLEARAAYQSAIDSQGPDKRPLTQMKLDDLVSAQVIDDDVTTTLTHNSGGDSK